MKNCCFLGSSKDDFVNRKECIKQIIESLIVEKGVTQFYCGNRGAFDLVCSSIVGELRKKYPHIKNTHVLSYRPKEEYKMPERYTDSVYLLEKYVPPRYAILETNKIMVDRSDFVVVSTRLSFGGAKTAREYAQKKGKTILDVDEFFETAK